MGKLFEGSVILSYFVSSLTVLIIGIVLSNADATVSTVLTCSIIVFSAFFCQCCLCSPVCLLCIAIGKIVNLICSIILAARCFKLKSVYDDQVKNYANKEWEEIKIAMWASEYHMYLGIASIVNTVLIVVWIVTVAKYVTDPDDDSESNAAENNAEQNVVTIEENNEAPNARSDFADFNAEPLLHETTHPEPSAPPMSSGSAYVPPISEVEMSVPPISDVEAPPPRYEDIYKTTKN